MDKIVLILFGFAVGSIFGVSLIKNHNAAIINKAVYTCNYEKHPISDTAIILYDQGLIPSGTVAYYINMMRSKNINASKCWKEMVDGK